MTQVMIEQYENAVEMLLDCESELDELTKKPLINAERIEFLNCQIKRLNGILDRLEGRA